jgi:plasmid stabilization system protein ParE
VRVEFSDEALLALQQIGDHIAADNAYRALSFVDELAAAAKAIGDAPATFPLIPNLERLGLRRRVHGAYLIVYRAEADRVVVMLFVHGARDYGPILNGDQG